ncbi:MAG: class I SAM-dependent methyltransferase [Planctomycetes bacterium]|nr:class I SAM-dependent methyltransferase [Planctomycetota bacterium]
MMGDREARIQVRCNVCGADDAEAVHPEVRLVRCRSCGMGYLNPQPSDDELARLYTDDYYTRPIDPGGPSYLENRAGLERFFDGRLRRIERLVRPGRLLEVGCGLGYLLNVARRRAWRAVGLEVSEFAAAYAQRELGLDVRRQTLEAAALPDAAFDAVVMRDLLEHTRDPRATLHHARRALRTGGVLALSMPNFASLNARLGGLAWRHLRPAQHLWHFTPECIARLLRECGLALAECTSRYDSPATREVYAALRAAATGETPVPPSRGQRVAQASSLWALAWHAALRGDIVFLPLGSPARRLLRAAATICACIARPFRARLQDDILELLALKQEAGR